MGLTKTKLSETLKALAMRTAGIAASSASQMIFACALNFVSLKLPQPIPIVGDNHDRRLFDATNQFRFPRLVVWGNISASPIALPQSVKSIHFSGGDSMSRLLSGLALLLIITTAVIAQPATGTIKKFAIKSSVLGEERIILVRTPVGYETNNVRYPVLYMTDGDAHMIHTASTIEFLTQNGRISDLIVVGVTNTDRTRDLTPVKSTNKTPNGELQFPTSGGADNFLKFFETEFIPEIEKDYRVQPYRIFAGHSLGGLFAIHAMMTKPGLFDAYIAVSPSLQWENGEALKRAQDFLSKQKEMNVTLFTSIGNESGPIGECFDRFKEAMAKTNIKGFDWQAERFADEDRSEEHTTELQT